MKKKLGNLSEDLACKKLKKMGYKIKDKNFSCKLGEIDLIAWDGEYLVFIEVRSRTKDIFGFPQETVNVRKRHKIRKVAQYYLIINKLDNIYCRFDVVSILWENEKKYKIDIFQDAF